MRDLMIVAILLLSGTAVSQQFADWRRAQPSDEVAESVKITPGDLNGDGRVDLVLHKPDTTRGHQSRQFALLSRGDGTFVPVRAFTQALGVADADADGDLDVLMEGSWMINDGRARFTKKKFNVFYINDARAAIGDVDGDGRQDVIQELFEGSYQGLCLHRGLANLAFARPVVLSSIRMDAIPELVDVDGDRDLDLIVGNRSGQTRLFLNDGKGNFTDRTTTLLPVDGAQTNDLVILDFDADGDPDLWLADPRPSLYLNDGKGKFTKSSVFARIPPGKTQSIAIGDIDGDQDLDVVLGEAEGGRVLEFRSGQFHVVTNRWSAGAARVRDVVLEDFDGDGDLDIFAARTSVARHGFVNDIAFNDGKGRFVRARQEPIPVAFRDGHVAMGRLDADQHEDLLSTEGTGTLLRGDGRGGFRTRVNLNLTVSGMPVLGDLDGDKDLDAVVLGDRTIHVCVNPGNGMLRLVRSYKISGIGAWVYLKGALADFNGDGNLDLFLSTFSYHPSTMNERDLIWSGDGALGFRDVSSAISIKTASYDLAVGDLDNDGDLDVFVSGGVVYLNQSTKTAFRFKATQFRVFGASVALGDMDSDGDLDAVFGVPCYFMGCHSAPPNSIYWNNGSGSFPTRLLLRATGYNFTRTTALADFDEDGDLDILFGNYTGVYPNDVLCRNDGNRQFTKLPVTAAFDDAARTFARDVDQDGDVDVVSINKSLYTPNEPVSRVIVNLNRQVQAPALPRIGQPYTLVTHGAAGGGILVASARSASIPFGFGVLGVDLSVAVVVATFAAGPAKRTTIVNVPRSGTLVGAPFYVQALVVGEGGARLTNTIAERFIGN